MISHKSYIIIIVHVPSEKPLAFSLVIMYLFIVNCYKLLQLIIIPFHFAVASAQVFISLVCYFFLNSSPGFWVDIYFHGTRTHFNKGPDDLRFRLSDFLAMLKIHWWPSAVSALCSGWCLFDIFRIFISILNLIWCM